MFKKFIKKIPFNCLRKYCLDEITGLVAIIFGIVAYVSQLSYSAKSYDMTSFSIIALIFTVLGELFFMIQGIQKRSATITLTRSITFLAFLSFIVLWIITHNKKKKTTDKK